nr:hypothetical protein [Tanacetum cinerariifolium]
MIEFPRFGGDDVKGKDMAWVIYKDLILKRFEDYVVYGCYQERDEKVNSVLKVFEEMPIKKVFKHDTNAEYYDVKESVKVGSGLVEEVVVETVKEPFEVESRLVVHQYVEQEIIGICVETDGKNADEWEYYEWELLCEWYNKGKQSHAKVRKNILLKIPLCPIGTTLHDYVHMAAKATGEFMKYYVVELMVSKMNPEVTRLVAIASEVTKFAIPKEFVREAFKKLLGSKLVSDTQIKSIVEPMSVSDMREEVFKNMVKSFECCYPQLSFVADIKIGWKLDKRLKGSHTIPSTSAMKSSFEVDVIRESSAARKWSLG